MKQSAQILNVEYRASTEAVKLKHHYHHFKGTTKMTIFIYLVNLVSTYYYSYYILPNSIFICTYRYSNPWNFNDQRKG